MLIMFKNIINIQVWKIHKETLKIIRDTHKIMFLNHIELTN